MTSLLSCIAFWGIYEGRENGFIGPCFTLLVSKDAPCTGREVGSEAVPFDHGTRIEIPPASAKSTNVRSSVTKPVKARLCTHRHADNHLQKSRCRAESMYVLDNDIYWTYMPIASSPTAASKIVQSVDVLNLLISFIAS